MWRVAKLSQGVGLARDLYETLGVKRGASDAEIKRAYRKLAKELHPDKNRDNPKAAERFKEVSSAFAILEDAQKRGQYDRGEIDADGNPRMPQGFGGGGFRPGAGPGGGGTRFEWEGDPSDLFAELFGRAGATPRGFEGMGGRFGGGRGADVAYKLTVPFTDAARLTPQRFALPGGRMLEVKLPPGLVTGTQIRLAGQGEAGAAGSGDALITLDIAPHQHFTRDGDDVRLDLPVRLDEAVLGAKVRVPTVDGPVTLSIPAGSTSGRVLRLRGKGFHRKGGGRGDQLVTLAVDLPAEDPELRAFAQRWEGAGQHHPRANFGLD
jgi:DnaJ-class molecular chaperone